ncbi:hypothetical protein KP509_09G100300 [Ceratopteris richardii]|uniref:LRAT domain-containing protein n=1 Tax=Ceratopteris richardii TaxID=49495 RepID=A0A8T2U6Y9_CERRI|nr:hypothetical protein KP509_09G100300 [Ceratopteris richardii]
MGLLSNKISKEELQVGDHIYSWRPCYSYAHHGIYIGDNKVINFTARAGGEEGMRGILNNLLISSLPQKSFQHCSECSQNMENTNGVVVSCLDCFFHGRPIHRFEYGVDTKTFLAQARGGTCTFAHADPIEDVLHRALFLWENGFGGYHLFSNNCEDFAIYCKTGLLLTSQSMGGRSGQIATNFLTIPLSVSSIYLAGLPTAVGIYCVSRYLKDLGIRRDVIKVPVEDLAINLGWSRSSITNDQT